MRYCQLSSFTNMYLDEYREPKPSLLCSIRVLIAFLSMLGTGIMYITRVNLNIAILAMVQASDLENKSISVDLNETAEAVAPLIKNQALPSSPIETVLIDPATPSNLLTGEFQWTPPEQGIILGSFFYGYLSTQVIGGRLAESYLPPDKLIFLALSSSGLLNLLTPFLARNSVTLFVISRILLGTLQGLVYPAFYCLLSKWIPSNERSTFLPWLDAGSILGTVLISATSGKIIVLFAKFGGWPVVFYFSGAIALLWSILWICFVRSNPEDHPLITKEELMLLSNDKQKQQQEQNPNSNQNNNSEKITLRWINIMTSPIFIGIVLTKISYGIVFDFVCQKIPAYFQDVIGLPVDETGLSFSFIMIGYMVTLLSCGAIADTIIKNTSFRTQTIRKLFQLTSGLIMILPFLLIPNIGLSKWANIFLLALVMLGYGFTSGGDIPAVVDISGPVSGTVFALMNTLCSISGFMVPYLVGVIIEPAPTSIALWRCLFITGAIIILFGVGSFLIFSSDELQTHWFKQGDNDNCPIKVQVLPLQFESMNRNYSHSLSLNMMHPMVASNTNNYNNNNIPNRRYETFPIGSL